MITRISTNEMTKITISNYDTYQDQRQGNRQASVKQMATDKNVKNVLKNNNLNIAFDVFWNKYEKKVGNKVQLQQKWCKLDDMERQNIIEALPDYIRSTPDKQFRMNPETYLNKRGWEHEIMPSYSKNNLSPDRKDSSFD